MIQLVIPGFVVSFAQNTKAASAKLLIRGLMETVFCLEPVHPQDQHSVQRHVQQLAGMNIEPMVPIYRTAKSASM